MTEDQHTRAALAALFAALVKALSEKSPGLEQSFVQHIDEAYDTLTESDGEHPQVLETLTWTKTMLAAETDPSEPAWVVYAKVRDLETEGLQSSDRIPQTSLADAVHFWQRLPANDRNRASIETAGGRRYDSAQIAKIVERFKTVRS